MKLFLFKKESFVKLFLVFDKMKNNPNELMGSCCNCLWFTHDEHAYAGNTHPDRRFAVPKRIGGNSKGMGKPIGTWPGRDDRTFPPLILFCG
jgi:hypothetical protein